MTVVPAEVERFNRLSATWWNPSGPMRPLHVINDLRVAYVCDQIEARFAGTGRATLAGLRILDIGCGAGLLCEPLARRGARVTGIDAAGHNIAAARLHAADQRLPIEYREGEAEVALRANERFDAVLLLEVVEHVSDVVQVIATAARSVAPGGLLFVSTIDRSWKSFVFAIVGAEYLFRVLPRGTHQWRRFVRPAEVESAAGDAGFASVDRRGMRYLPVLHRAAWIRDTSVNYIATFARPAAASRLP